MHKIDNILKKNIKSCFVKNFTESKWAKNTRAKWETFPFQKQSKAINNAEIENYEIAIIDDSLQDKTINYDVGLFIITWIGLTQTIPSGPLRENINKLKQYDHVFLNGNKLSNLKKEIKNINSKISIHVGTYDNKFRWI